MPAKRDLQIAKWLVRHKYLEKSDAENALREQKKLEKAGKKLNLLQIINKLGLLERQVLVKVQAELMNATKQGKENLKPREESQEPVESARLKIVSDAKPITVEDESEEEEDEEDEYEVEEDLSGEDNDDGGTVIETSIDAASTRVCPECSFSVSFKDRECPVCAAPVPKDAQMNCKGCRQVVGAKDRQCGYCGANPQTGAPGKKAPRCRHCKHPVLPEDALCTKCGEFLVDRSLLMTREGLLSKIVLAVLVMCSFTAYGVSIYHLREEPEYVTAIPNEVISRFDQIEPFVIRKYDPDRKGEPQSKLLTESMVMAKEGQWSELAEKLKFQQRILNANLLNLWAYAMFKSDEDELVIALQKNFNRDPFLRVLAGEIRLKECKKLVEAKRFAEALVALEPVTNWEHDDAEIYFWLGIASFGSSAELKSKVYFERCLSLSEDWPEAYLFLAVLQKENRTILDEVLAKINKTRLIENYPEIIKELK